MRIVCVSDTHMQHSRMVVPDGDVLIHAGDSTGRGSEMEILSVNTWLGTLPHKHKILIAGNHDWLFQKSPNLARALIIHATYLQDEEVTIDGVRFYGSPWQPWFFDWAFNLQRGAEIAEKWKLIPDGIDVLITHGPPHGILDRAPGDRVVGCEELRKVVDRIKPQLHVFGHIHSSYGEKAQDGTIFVNACTCPESYALPLHDPIVIDL